MHNLLPIAFAFLVGMGHAFEADHLIAVSTLVARHDSRLLAVKDGLYWGLGHTTTLVVFGGLLLGTRLTLAHSNYFEAAVGAMLLLMGLSRLTNKAYYRKGPMPARYRRSTAYAVGLVHGLAGSGALVLLVMGSIPSVGLGLAYLLLFGLGSVVGMLGATGLMSVPFTQRMRFSHSLRVGMVVASALVSICYGGWMLYSNLVRTEDKDLRTQTSSAPTLVLPAQATFLFHL
ncbi:urease accessory protein [Hymenobacter fodinae]|uniref:Urease accessory protein n=1 Tax=Hymenobacter fodinae TaxID=2510796 RepID=A0A4Z0P651_9BACT|nr:urease accessory protein [Hymenobacter fodinae]TGE07609.1 urease accessory protein [Hymenobacter fodinae]